MPETTTVTIASLPYRVIQSIFPLYSHIEPYNPINGTVQVDTGSYKKLIIYKSRGIVRGYVSGLLFIEEEL